MQSIVNFDLAYGMPGEIAYTGPIRALPWTLKSPGKENGIGLAYTISDESQGVATVGGAGVFAGILINPKNHLNYGNLSDGALGASYVVPDGEIGALLTMGAIWVKLESAIANVGDAVIFDKDTGKLYSGGPATNPPLPDAVPNAIVQRFTATSAGNGTALIILTN